MNYGTMNVDDSTFSGNTASLQYRGLANGGGGANVGGTLNVYSTNFTNDQARWGGSGGAIWSQGVIVSVTSGTFSGNASDNAGGAIELAGGAHVSESYGIYS